jgi:hypothetical protein
MGGEDRGDSAGTPDGTVYVTDSGLKVGKDGSLEASGSDAVHSISKWGQYKRLIKSEDLGQPRAVAADAQGVWIGSWTKAELFRVSKWGKREDPVKAPASQLDGFTRLPDGTMLLSSIKTQTVYIGRPGGKFSVVADNAPGAAGVGYDARRRRALIPLSSKNTLVIEELSGFEETADVTGDE